MQFQTEKNVFSLQGNISFGHSSENWDEPRFKSESKIKIYLSCQYIYFYIKKYNYLYIGREHKNND